MIEFNNGIQKLFNVTHINFEALASSSTTTIFVNDQRTERHLKFSYLRNVERIEQNRSHKKNDYTRYSPVTESGCESESQDEEFVPYFEKRKKSAQQAITLDPSAVVNKIIKEPIVTSALDRVGLPDDQFRLIMGPIASVMKADSTKTRLSRSTIKRKWNVNRKGVAETIKERFVSESALTNFIVHWDGKLLSDSTNPNFALKKRKTDRIAVAVSGNGTSKLLGIPEVSNGTGFQMARVIFNMGYNWKCSRNVL